MDRQTIVSILNLLHTFQEATQELYTNTNLGQSTSFYQMCDDMAAGLTEILRLICTEDSSGNQKLKPVCQSILDSLRRVRIYHRLDRKRCLSKIEFELLPLLQEAYAIYYVFQYLANDRDHWEEYNEREHSILYGNSYIDQALESGKYKYNVSICVRGYNKLEYTRQCVSSLMDNIPAYLNYELILVNHGSSDGTKEYFESIHPHKQLDIAVNGGGLGALERIVEGEFMILISNDIIVTPHAIENLLNCIRSDSRIAWAVPATPNISNLQVIPASYSTQEELTAFAYRNNQSCPFRWEQRVRLCNPMEIRRSDVFLATTGVCPISRIHTTDFVHSRSFPDDRTSLLLRRSGYKLVLAKDAYCHHFGSVTLKDEVRQQNEQKYYLEGRRHFYQAFGVDPWGTGFCYDPVFMNRVVGDELGHVDILGINCGLGSNSLKIKEQIKEYCHNMDTYLSNITDDASFLQDLQGISDEAAVIGSIKAWKSFLNGRTFRYIVWETPFLTSYKFKTLLAQAINALTPGGGLFIKQTAQSREALARNDFDRAELGNGWIILRREAAP